MQETQEMWFISWVRKIPGSKAWQPTPVLLPGESHEQRSLAGYSVQGCKESDVAEAAQQRKVSRVERLLHAMVLEITQSLETVTCRGKLYVCVKPSQLILCLLQTVVKKCYYLNGWHQNCSYIVNCFWLEFYLNVCRRHTGTKTSKKRANMSVEKIFFGSS